MKNPLRILRPKRRQYPVEFDEQGRSRRRVCFEAFDLGKRPAQVIREYNYKPNTVYSYWKQWKKLHRSWHKSREHLRLFKKADPDFFHDAALYAGKKLGMSPQEVLVHMDKPYGLLDLVQGKWPLHDTAPATNKAIAILYDIMRIIFLGQFQGDHPRNIVRDLEADGIDFTEKRTGRKTQESSQESEDTIREEEMNEDDIGD
ncbi:MAG: hypothetical protein HQ553_04040 [Chloroflexi bacterium]|nr:hypothetical protein [Chloroflexota bacterium]